jgi:hypothetical protein
VKPVAFGLMMSMLVIAWAAFANVGVLDGSRWGDVLGTCSLAAGTILGLGWARSSQRLARWGLLAAFGVWTARVALILLVNHQPITTEGLWLSIAWGAIAAGSYFLEATAAPCSRGG